MKWVILEIYCCINWLEDLKSSSEALQQLLIDIIDNWYVFDIIDNIIDTGVIDISNDF